MTDRLTEITTTLKAQLMADRKKSALLGGLLVVFLVVLGRALFSGSSPAPVAATEQAVAITNPASQPTPPAPPSNLVRPIEEAGPNAFATLGAAVRESLTLQMKVAEAAASAESLAAASEPLPLLPERKDLFSAPAWGHGAKESSDPDDPDGKHSKSRKPKKSKKEQEKPFWGNLGSALGEYQQIRRGEVAEYEAQLAGLELQSTLTGPVPRAYISGRLVRVGDTVRGFSIVRIEDRRVVVKKQAFMRVLVMP